MLMNNNTVEIVRDVESPRQCEGETITDKHLMTFISSGDRTMLVSTLLSAILQLFVIKHALKHIRQRTNDQCLHIFLFSMTLGDFLLTGVCYPIELLPRMADALGVDINFPYLVNLSMHATAWIAMLASSLSLVLLNVDKLLYFKCPLQYSSYITRSRGLSMVCSLWLGCAGFVAVAWLTGSFICSEDNCEGLSLFPDAAGMYIAFLLSACVIPTISSLSVAIYVLHVVSIHRKQLAEEQSLCRSSHASTVSHVIASRLKTFYFIFMSSLLTACTLLPYRCMQLGRIVADWTKDESDETSPSSCATYLLLWIFSYGVMLNAILNPVMTVTILPAYRLRLLRKWCGRRKGGDPMRTRATTDL